MSRQYVERLIENGKLAATRKPGSKHKLLRVEDVIAFRDRRDDRRAGVAKMVSDVVEAGAEY